jgi:DNA-binding LacI/PurR family transcriptional regulator
MGYVSDPLLASLSSYRTRRRPTAFRATLAWVTNHPTHDSWRKAEVFHQYFLGAQERAHALGFRLEEFWLREPGLTGARASQILHARGVTGLLIAPQPHAGISLELDWPGFSAVALGYTLANPSLHLVSTHQYRSIKLAVRRLCERGYQRIGFVMLAASDDRVDQNWLAGYLVMQRLFPAARQLPPLLLAKWDEDVFRRWVRRHRPDAFVTKSEEALPALARMGLQVPHDIGLAFLTLPSVTGDFSGVDENPREVGVTAVDFLVGMIHRNERGAPAMPQRVLIDGTWIDGQTVRPAPVTAPH